MRKTLRGNTLRKIEEPVLIPIRREAVGAPNRFIIIQIESAVFPIKDPRDNIVILRPFHSDIVWSDVSMGEKHARCRLDRWR